MIEYPYLNYKILCLKHLPIIGTLTKASNYHPLNFFFNCFYENHILYSDNYLYIQLFRAFYDIILVGFLWAVTCTHFTVLQLTGLDNCI